MTAANPSVAAGLTVQFAATGTYSDGTTAVMTGSVSWASASGNIAIINSSGLATGKSAGTSVISATSGSVTGSATLTVNPPSLVSITLAPSTATMGSTTQLAATGTYSDQSTQDLTDTVTWTAANTWVGTISTAGAFSPVHTGYTAITAADGSVQGAGAITVLASPRYLLLANYDTSNISRLGVDAATGQPHALGYLATNISGSIAAPCLTLNPEGTDAYFTVDTQASGGSGYAGTVSAYSVDPSSGSLSAISTSPAAVAMAPGCLHFAPSGKFAYAISGIDNSGNQVGIFSVNTDGTLSLTNTVTLPDNPTGVAVDPFGKYLYAATLASPFDTTSAAFLYGYSMDASTGALTPLAGSPWGLPSGTWGELSISPSGNNLYASDENGTAILEFTLDRGTGVPGQPLSFDSSCINPSGLSFSPDGAHAYATCGESSSGSVVQVPLMDYSVGANGGLSVLATANAGPGAGPIQVDPSGKYVYVLGSGKNYVGSSPTVAGNALLIYQVQTDGSVKFVRQVAGQKNNSMVLLSGAAPLTWTTTNAYITTAGDDKVTPYAVHSDGTLTPGTALTTVAAPFSATMLPWGSDLLFAAQASTPNLFGYAVSGISILNGTSLAAASSAGGIAISPSGQWAYATDPASGLVDVLYSLSAGNWGLTYSSPGGPLYTYSAQAGAGPITIDAGGRYIVVANQASKSLSLIDSQGAAPVPPVSLSFTPLTITADATGNFFFTAGDDGELHMFVSNGLGSLADVAQATLPGTNTVSVAVDPFGGFVYAAGPAGLSAFAVDPNAATLTAISLNIPVSLADATGVFVDPSGKFLYVAVSNATTKALYLFTINSDGTLTAASTTPVAAPNQATSMVFQESVH